MKPSYTLAAVVALTTSITPVAAQQQGSTGCTTLTQAAANAITTRIAADDRDIKPPQLLRELTCLDDFFKGVGLDVVVNLLDPNTLFQSIQGRLCNLVRDKWNSLIGNVQCGLTVSGFDLGFFGSIGGNINGGGFDGGVRCPRLQFGGGGPPIISIGTGQNNNGHLYFTGNGLPPTGYTLPENGGIW